MQFTKNNTHDFGAIENSHNRVLNLNDTVAKDRGSSYVVLNSTNYQGNGLTRVQILEELWVLDDFWTNFYYSTLVLSLLSICVGYIRSPQNKRDAAENEVKTDYQLCFLRVLDILKDFYYLLWFPHFSLLITLGLAFTIIICLFVPEKAFGGEGDINCSEQENQSHFSKRVTDVVLQFFGIKCKEKNNIQRQLYIFAVIACFGNLPQLCLKFYDSLLMGNTFTAF